MENKNKLLLPYRNKTIVEITVGQVLSAGIEDIVVVTGRDGDQVEALLQHLPLRVVHNPDFSLGLTGSIQKGITVARGNGYMICLADMVLVTPAEYGLLAEYFTRQRAFDPKCICLPVHEGQKGNPVVFSSWYKTAIAGHTEAEGCREIVQAHSDNVYRVEMPTPHVLQDIDFPEDYHRLMAG